MATFKRRTSEELFGAQWRRILSEQDDDDVFTAQQHDLLDRQKAELKGAMIVGMLYQQQKPGVFATDVYQRLSDPVQPLSRPLLKLLRRLGEPGEAR